MSIQSTILHDTSHPENQKMDVRRQVQGVSGSGIWKLQTGGKRHRYLSETNIVVLIWPSQALWPQRGARAYYADSAYYYTLLTEKGLSSVWAILAKSCFALAKIKLGMFGWMEGVRRNLIWANGKVLLLRWVPWLLSLFCINRIVVFLYPAIKY